MSTRCAWVTQDPVYIRYHDVEWGVPVFDDRSLFESLVLDGFQAGLSWITILKKRDAFRRAFDGFDVQKMAGYGEEKVTELLQDAGIVRNRLKIQAAIGNARAFLKLRERHGSFSDYVWRFVNHRPRHNSWKSLSQLPARTPESDAMSKALQQEGFRFVGSTICYAFMQAVGMVNDHTVDCFRYHQLTQGR